MCIPPPSKRTTRCDNCEREEALVDIAYACDDHGTPILAFCRDCAYLAGEDDPADDLYREERAAERMDAQAN